MNQVIPANCLQFRIREKSKCIAGFLDHVPASLLGRVNADPHNSDPSLDELVQIFFDTPQLGVTVASPIPSVKDQQHTSRRLVVNGLR